MADDKKNKHSKILAFPGNRRNQDASIEDLEERLQEQIDNIRSNPCACECLIESLIETLIEHNIIESRDEAIHPRLLIWALGVTAGFVVADHMAGFVGAESSAILDLNAGAYEGIAITTESEDWDEE